MILRHLARLRQIGAGVAHELRGGFALAADTRSFLRFASDVFLSRLTRVVPMASRNQTRKIRVRGGIELHYRLNRGDMQSIREVWIDECYQLPFDLVPERMVDLGANIGLTSLWFAHRYGCKSVIAVEPSPANAQVVRLNLEGNNVNAQVVQAAVGAHDGTAFFEDAVDSNLGHLASAGGREVQVVSMDTLLSGLPSSAQIDVVKMDIEGGEGPLMRENLAWLGRVKSLIAEFHPEVIDFPAVIRSIENQGFRYIPAHSVGPDSMDAFVRVS
ncbi:MAG TPA: FkbM family methyltransferase [Polyangia bacterium]|jgi:FkbM family methyltransferase